MRETSRNYDSKAISRFHDQFFDLLREQKRRSNSDNVPAELGGNQDVSRKADAMIAYVTSGSLLLPGGRRRAVRATINRTFLLDDTTFSLTFRRCQRRFARRNGIVYLLFHFHEYFCGQVQLKCSFSVLVIVSLSRGDRESPRPDCVENG